jgi:hypothetical protein
MNELLDRFQNYEPTKWVRSIEWDDERQNVTVGDGYRDVKYIQCNGMSLEEIWVEVTKYVKSRCKATK